MKSLNIITITDGNLNSLKKTLISIDGQNYKNYKNYIISKKKINNLDNKFKKKQRVFIYKKNCSIYEAMNLGLKKSKYNSVIFLNSGDIFYKKSSLNTISKHIKQNSKKCLMFVSILKNNKDYFFPKKRTFLNENFLTHSSFIRPPNKNDKGFNPKNKITADGEWMRKNIKRYSIKKIYETVTIFYLGGISNLPSRRSLSMKLNTGILSILKEFIKFLLLKLLGQKKFYKIIYFFKYDKVETNEIEKSMKNHN